MLKNQKVQLSDQSWSEAEKLRPRVRRVEMNLAAQLQLYWAKKKIDLGTKDAGDNINSISGYILTYVRVHTDGKISRGFRVSSKEGEEK